MGNWGDNESISMYITSVQSFFVVLEISLPNWTTLFLKMNFRHITVQLPSQAHRFLHLLCKSFRVRWRHSQDPFEIPLPILWWEMDGDHVLGWVVPSLYHQVILRLPVLLPLSSLTLNRVGCKFNFRQDNMRPPSVTQKSICNHPDRNYPSNH